MVQLSLFHDRPSSDDVAARFSQGNLLERVHQTDTQARERGLASLDTRDELVKIGMEVNGHGTVSKNSFGVFHLSWLAAQHPEWPDQIVRELDEIRTRLKQAHGTKLQYLIWAGMGGSAEDKSLYQAAGLLKKGPRVYVLDSTDPAKLAAILEDMTRRSRQSLPEVLKRTLVVGMALGMTSYEPLVNLEKLAALYDRYSIDSSANFCYMTLPGSLLDQFGQARGLRNIPLQLDGGNSTAGRHSSPLTRGSLYPLGLAGVDLKQWMAATVLTDEEIDSAWRLAAFLHTQIKAGRNKITLITPKEWAGIGVWTKQDFEESLGKSEEFGLKVVIQERIRPVNYRAPKEQGQDRVFLCIQVKQLPHPESQKVALLRRAGYPVAVLSLTRPQLSRYMQFIHYCVFGIAYLEQMNFVTQPSVELYKSITQRIVDEAKSKGGIEQTDSWRELHETSRRAAWLGRLTLVYAGGPEINPTSRETAPAIYCKLLRTAIQHGVEYGELTFFGDLRYSAKGKLMRKSLDHAGEKLFRNKVKVPVDIYEGPAMNHSYHEMIIGHGRCFSTILLSEKAEELPAAQYTADYHRAQFLATQAALRERGRSVVALLLKDLEEPTLKALDQFFAEAARIWQSSKT